LSRLANRFVPNFRFFEALALNQTASRCSFGLCILVISSGVTLLAGCGGGGHPAPTVTVTANPTSITEGATTTLTWSSTNAISCTASGAWSGAEATSGTTVETPSASGNETYTLTCTGSGGSANASATVAVGVPPAPTVSISASPTGITLGGSSSVTWSSTNATSCTASGGWSGTLGTSGTQSITPTAVGTDSLTLTCTGAGGSENASTSITVAAPSPTVTISISPTTVTLGNTATVTWSSTNATACTATGAWTGTETTSGTATETPTAVGNDTYTLTCTGAGGSANGSAALTVNAPPSEGFIYTLNSNLNPAEIANISGYSISSSTGALTLLPDSPYNDALNASDAIAVDPQLKLLFAAGAGAGTQTTGEIAAFSINPSTGSLTATVTTTPAIEPNWLTVGPNGQFLYVSHHAANSISAYSVGSNGALTEVSGSPFTLPASNCGLFCNATADQMVYDQQAQTLYVESDYGWVIGTFTVNATTGALTWVYNEPTGAGPSAVITDTTGQFVYTTNAPGASVTAYSVTTAAMNGTTPQPLTAVPGQPFSAGNTPLGLVIEPTDHYLYVLNSGDNSISSYSINSTSGALTALSGAPLSITGGSTNDTQIIVDPLGQYLYAVGPDYNGSVGGVTQFSINTTTGALTQVTATPVSPGTNANAPTAIVFYKPQ
jgi:6-phosphogluconolactonase (cycloisomerase 2 family)